MKIFDSTTGERLHFLVNPAPKAGDNFGSSVAISGTRVVVGAPNFDTLALRDIGRAYVFDLASATPLRLPFPECVW